MAQELVRKLVKQLEGRERELVTNAAVAVAMAVERLQKVQEEGAVLERHYNAMLEMATGDPKTEDLKLDLGTSQIYRMVPPKPRPKRGKAKGRKPANQKSKKGGR